MTTRRRHITRRRAGTLPALPALLLLPAAPAGAQATGGLEAAPNSLEVRPASLAQRTLRIAGEVGAEHAGRTVRIERELIDGSWEPIATAVADGGGAFAAAWRSDVAGRYALR